jgi:hypothetical protein
MSDREAIDLGPLVSRLETELEEEFPGWLIAREESGRWSARLPEWGVLYGQDIAELRGRLRAYAEGTGADE